MKTNRLDSMGNVLTCFVGSSLQQFAADALRCCFVFTVMLVCWVAGLFLSLFLLGCFQLVTGSRRLMEWVLLCFLCKTWCDAWCFGSLHALSVAPLVHPQGLFWVFCAGRPVRSINTNKLRRRLRLGGRNLHVSKYYGLLIFCAGWQVRATFYKPI